MAIITKTNTYNTGDTLTAAKYETDRDDVIDDYNGNITNANIAAGAAIDLTKLASTPATLTGSETLTNKTLTSPVVNNPTMKGAVNTLVTAADGATVTFDLDSGNIQAVTLEGNRTLAISNENAGQVFVLRLIQDGTGSRTVTWFSTIKWAGGSAPTLTTTASKEDVLGFITTSTDNYLGFIVGQNL